MEGRTITRADLSESVFQEVGLSRNESSDLVETILSEVVEALARGEIGEDLVVRELHGSRQGPTRGPQSEDGAGGSDPAAPRTSSFERRTS